MQLLNLAGGAVIAAIPLAILAAAATERWWVVTGLLWAAAILAVLSTRQTLTEEDPCEP